MPPVADAPEPLYGEYEREKLMPFYQRVADAIRAVDSNKSFLWTPRWAQIWGCAGTSSRYQPTGNGIHCKRMRRMGMI